MHVYVSVRPHPLFERRGNDVWCEMPITFTQAALGADVEVPTLDGKVSYHVHEGTQPGDVFRLKGKGIQGLGSRMRGRPVCPSHRGGAQKLVHQRQKEILAELDKASDDKNYAKRKSFFGKLKDLFGSNPLGRAAACRGGLFFLPKRARLSRRARHEKKRRCPVFFVALVLKAAPLPLANPVGTCYNSCGFNHFGGVEYGAIYQPRESCKGMEMGDIPSNREILKTTLSVAWPSVLESFFVNLAGMVDTIMVGTMGSYAIAAVGLTSSPRCWRWRCSFP